MSNIEWYINKQDNFVVFLNSLVQCHCPEMQWLIDTWSIKNYDDIKYLSDTKLKPAMLMGPELVADLLLAHYKIDKKRFSTGIIGFGYGYGCTLLENLSKTPYSPVSLDGMTRTLMKNEQVLNLLVELNVEYSNFESVTRPKQRLLYITAFTALSVGMSNINKASQQKTDLASSH